MNLNFVMVALAFGVGTILAAPVPQSTNAGPGGREHHGDPLLNHKNQAHNCDELEPFEHCDNQSVQDLSGYVHEDFDPGISRQTLYTGRSSDRSNSRRDLVYHSLQKRYPSIFEARGFVDDMEILRKRDLVAELKEHSKKYAVQKVADKLGVDPQTLGGHAGHSDNDGMHGAHHLT